MPSSLSSPLADPDRLAVLRQTNLLDSPTDEAFDRLVRLGARVLHAPIALISLFDEDRQFFKACVGLPEPWASARQTPVHDSLWRELPPADRPLVIGDARRDTGGHHTWLVSELGVAACLGISLTTSSGHVLGSFCVADWQPRSWTADDTATMAELAGVAMTQIEPRIGSHDPRACAELERRLAGVEAGFRTLRERLPGVVYTVGPGSPNPLTYVSPQIEALVGEPATACIGVPNVWDRWLHPDDADWVHAECERTNRTGEPFAAEYRMCTRDGQVRWVRDEAVLVRGHDGRALFWQGILTDMTASHQTAARLAGALQREQEAARQLTAALEHERAAAEHLRAVDEMKTTFLQAVSHDLRTPLTTILGIALTLERSAAGLPARDIADLLHRLSSNARKLDGLLADLLDLDRLARGTLIPRRQLIDIGALTRRVVDEAGVRDEHPLVVEAPAAHLEVDAPKVERIVENLVVNAARHTPAGTTIWIRVDPRPDGVLLLVEDEGPGVPAHLREQVFQPFHKGRNVADHAPGSGIGLALVAQFASLQGGSAWVEERAGGGASFRVFFPALGPGQRHSGRIS